MALTFLTDAGLINDTLLHVDNLQTGLADAYNAERVVRYTSILQQIVVEFWMREDWPWALTSTTLTAGDEDLGKTLLPDDFLEMTKSCSVVETATGLIFKGEDVQVLNREVTASQLVKAPIYGIGQVGASMERMLLTPQQWDGTGLTFVYKRQPPNVDIAPGEGDFDALSQIPAVYHYTVFQPYMRFRGFEDLGREAAVTWKAAYEQGLHGACQTERIGGQKDSVHRIGRSRQYRMY